MAAFAATLEVGFFMTSIHLPPHQLEIDEVHFLRLLAGCVCLLKEEKRKIIEAVPRLSQYQIDELIEIWEDEARQAATASLDPRYREEWRLIRRGAARQWAELERELSN